MKEEAEMILGTRAEILIAEILQLDCGEEEYINKETLIKSFNDLSSEKMSEKAIELLALKNDVIIGMLARGTNFEKLPLLASLLFKEGRFTIDNALALNTTLPESIHTELLQKYDDPKHSGAISGNPFETLNAEKKMGEAESRAILKTLKELI